jgi:hypothetical protein
MKARSILALGAFFAVGAFSSASGQTIPKFEPLPSRTLALSLDSGPTSVFDIMLLDEYVVSDDIFALKPADERRNRELDRVFAKRRPPNREVRFLGDRDLPMGLDTGISDLTAAAWKIRNTVTDYKLGDTTVTVHGRIGLVFKQDNSRAWIIGRKNRNSGIMHSYELDSSPYHMLRYGIFEPVSEIVPFTIKTVTFPLRKLGDAFRKED